MQLSGGSYGRMAIEAILVAKQVIWLVGQAVKTPPSHGGNRGSIPLRAVSINNKNDINTKHCEAMSLVREQKHKICN